MKVCFAISALLLLLSVMACERIDDSQYSHPQLQKTAPTAQPKAQVHKEPGNGGAVRISETSKPLTSGQQCHNNNQVPEWLTRLLFLLLGTGLTFVGKWLLSNKEIRDAMEKAANTRQGEMSVNVGSEAFAYVTKAMSSFIGDTTAGTLDFMCGLEEWRLNSWQFLPAEFDTHWMEIISKLRKIDRRETINASSNVSESHSMKMWDEIEEYQERIDTCFEMARASLEEKFGKRK